jgi:hypothetical protein
VCFYFLSAGRIKFVRGPPFGDPWYKQCDIFNADKTALFYKCMPDKTLTFKNEKCNGSKHSKERLTLLLAVNMTGTNKLKPLIIGKSKKPRC